MATLAAQTMTPAGVVLTYNAAGVSGDKVPTGDDVFVLVKNGSGSPVTVTVNDPNTVSPKGAHTFDPDLAVTVAAGAEVAVGPLPSSRFADPADALAHITYSSATSVTIAVVRKGAAS